MAEQKPSITDELLKLAELKEKGVLTEEEFASAKAALLRSLHAATPPETKVCDSCNGSGKCFKCEGAGEYYFNRLAGFARGRGKLQDCDYCNRTGRCSDCAGKGNVLVKK